MHVGNLMGFIAGRVAQLRKNSRRFFAMLSGLIIIFDAIAGLSSVWEHELARVQTARLRLGVCIAACVAAAILELHSHGQLKCLQAGHIHAVQLFLVWKRNKDQKKRWKKLAK